MPATARPGRLTVLPSGEQFEISSGAHRATIVEVGGGLREYEVDGRAVIEPYFADRMCDGAHGAPLIPWPNRLADGRYTFDGDEYQVPLTESEKRNAIHGFLLWRSWDAVEGDADRVGMSTRLYPLDGYPFTLDVRVDYQLGSEGLIVTTTVENVGDRDCPYGHGQHPGARRDRRLHGATGRPHPELPGAAAARGHRSTSPSRSWSAPFKRPRQLWRRIGHGSGVPRTGARGQHQGGTSKKRRP